MQGNEEAAKAAVDAGDYDFALMIESPQNYKYMEKDVGMYDTTATIIQETMIAKHRLDTLQTLGVSPQVSQEILNPTVKGEVIQIGKDQFSSFFYTYILIFALYMAILLYGQFVATR